MSHDPKSKDFDPYSAWLGIAPGPRPPTPEDLLGIAPGESNADRILAAAMERKKRLNGFALSEHNKLASDLASEVADAMSLLMKRAASTPGYPAAPPPSERQADEATDLTAGVVRLLELPAPIGRGAAPEGEHGDGRVVRQPPVPAAFPREAPPAISSDVRAEDLESGRTLKDLERAVAMTGGWAGPDPTTDILAMPPRTDGEEASVAERKIDDWKTRAIRTALAMDARLKAVVGEENTILINFCRVLAPGLLAAAVLVGVVLLVGRLIPQPSEHAASAAAETLVSDSGQDPAAASEESHRASLPGDTGLTPREEAGPADARTQETPAPPTADEPIGHVVSTRQVLLRWDFGTGSWTRMSDGAAIRGNDRLLGLPAFQPRVVLGNVSMLLVDAAALTPAPSVGVRSAGVNVEFGRVLARTADGAGGASLRIVVNDRSGVCQFADAESAVAIEVRRPGAVIEDPERRPADLEADLYVISGEVIWRGETKGSEIRINGLSRLRMWEPPLQAVPVQQLPGWMSRDATSELDQRAAAVLESAVAPERPAALALRESSSHRRREVRWLAMRSLGILGDYGPLVTALGDPDERLHWPDVIGQLREAVLRGPSSAAGVRTAIERQHGSEGAALYEMLWKYRPETLQAQDANRLVDFLDHDSLPFRVLGYWNLNKCYNRGNFYRPEDSSARRAAAVRKWREFVKTGATVRSTRPGVP